MEQKLQDEALRQRVVDLERMLKELEQGRIQKDIQQVPGMDVPDEMIERMKGVPKEKQPEEDIRICVEAIQRIEEIPGVRGIHIMAIEWEGKVAEIAKASSLLPRPQPIQA